MQEIDNQIYPDIPGYEIHAELGRGGIATVYLAVQESLDRQVALKVISPLLAAEPDYAERFIREGRTVAQLNHPNIITVYDIGLQKHQLFIAMEYIPGGNLRNLLTKHKGDAEWALGVTGQIAMALGYAHRAGIVHRDVKPENILFRENGTAVLTDFGIAKTITSDTNLTRAGTIIGTPKYMSPEQTDGLGNDPRTDIYSLGIILHEMLTGSVPYESENSMAVLYAHVHSAVPQLPEDMVDLQPLLNSMMAKNCDERANDCDELAEIIRITRRERHYALKNGRPMSAISTGEQKQYGMQEIAAHEAADSTTEGSAPRSSLLKSVQEKLTSSLGEKRTYWIALATIVMFIFLGVMLNQDQTPPPEPVRAISSANKPAMSETGTSSADTDGNTQQAGNARQQPAVATTAADVNTEVSNTGAPVSAADKSDADRLVHESNNQSQVLISKFLADESNDELVKQQQATQPQAPSPPAKLTRRQWQINSLLAEARIAIEEGNIHTPPEKNAIALYQQVLELSPRSNRARRGLIVSADLLFEQAREYYKTDDMDLALNLVNIGLEAAPEHIKLQTLKQGIDASFNPNSSYARGEKFYLGIDGPQSYTRAAFYYQKAAERGHILAMNALGVSYANGAGVTQSDTQALKWFLKAAEKGNAESMYNLALGYIFSSQPNLTWALPWAEKASQADYRPSFMLIGWMHTTGTGTPASTVQSIRWDLKGMVNPISASLSSQYRIPNKWQRDFMVEYKRATDSGPNATVEKKTATDIFQ